MTFKIKEGVAIAGSQFVDSNRSITANTLTLSANTSSTTSGTGSLIVVGGVGISENINIGGNLSVGGSFELAGTVTIGGGDVTIAGNLIVNGTTTTINSTEISVDDKNIVLGAIAAPDNDSANGGGITLKAAADKTITWVKITDRWTSNVGFEAASIQNTPIGSTTASTGSFTTLAASGASTLAGLSATTGSFSSTLASTGNLTVNTDKFVVTATSGNTTVAGTLGVTGAITGSSTMSATQYTSTIADGTAPLVVTSTTKVTNLNADLLDGYNSDTANTASTVVVRNASKNILFSNAVMSGATSGTTTLQPSATASGTLTLPAATDTLVARDTTDTLKNKSISLGDNTVTGTLAQFNTAVSDADLASIAGTETLTNKTLTNPTLNVGSGTLVLPQKNVPDQTANGSVQWDADGFLLTIGDGSARKTMVDTNSTQTLTNKTLTSPSITGISPTITLTGDVTGSGTMTDLGSVSFSTTIAANSVALGTDTTGNYVASVSTGTGLTGGVAGAEGTTPTISLSHLGIQDLTDPNADRIMFWDDSAGKVDWLTVSTGLSISGTTITNSDLGSSQNIFKNIAVSGQTDVVADSNNDTLTFVAGGAITLTTDANADSVTIAHTDTSSQGSVDNSNGNVIQDITLDTYGHITAIGSVDLDSRYFTETESDARYAFRSKINTGVMNAGTWYTIAINYGNRASGKFVLNDFTSSAHQSVHFYASHFFGNGNSITVLHQNRYSTSPFRYIRIKEGSTYDGALLQVYIDSATDSGNYTLYENDQSSGWSLVNPTVDGTDPGGLAAFGALTTVAAQVDLDQGVGAQGGNMLTTGDIYAGGQTTQYQVLHANNVSSYVGNGTFSVSAGGGLTGSGSMTANQSGNSSVTISHSDTSSQASISNSGTTVIQSVSVDDYGHVTSMSSTTISTATIGKAIAMTLVFG